MPPNTLCRHTGGALFPLLISFMETLNRVWRANPGIVLQPSCDPQTVLRTLSGDMRALAGLLAELDTLSFAAAVRLQEPLLAGLHILWQTMLVRCSWASCRHSWQRGGMHVPMLGLPLALNDGNLGWLQPAV